MVKYLGARIERPSSCARLILRLRQQVPEVAHFCARRVCGVTDEGVERTRVEEENQRQKDLDRKIKAAAQFPQPFIRLLREIRHNNLHRFHKKPSYRVVYVDQVVRGCFLTNNHFIHFLRTFI